MKIMTGKCKDHIWGCCIAVIKPHWGTVDEHPEKTQDIIDEIERRLNEYETLKKAVGFLSAEDAERISRILENEEEYFLMEDVDNFAKTLRGE